MSKAYNVGEVQCSNPFQPDIRYPTYPLFVQVRIFAIKQQTALICTLYKVISLVLILVLNLLNFCPQNGPIREEEEILALMWFATERYSPIIQLSR